MSYTDEKIIQEMNDNIIELVVNCISCGKAISTKQYHDNEGCCDDCMSLTY